jgi:hypothetical protein
MTSSNPKPPWERFRADARPVEIEPPQRMYGLRPDGPPRPDTVADLKAASDRAHAKDHRLLTPLRLIVLGCVVAGAVLCLAIYL